MEKPAVRIYLYTVISLMSPTAQNTPLSGRESYVPQALTQLHMDMEWLSRWLDARGKNTSAPFEDMLASHPAPALHIDPWLSSPAERLVLAISWAPYLRPGLLTAIREDFNRLPPK